MLKIKDNVDLKELDKYGFEKDGVLGYILTEYENENWQKILVRINNERIISFNYGSSKETIQSLIKDELVEEIIDASEITSGKIDARKYLDGLVEKVNE